MAVPSILPLALFIVSHLLLLHSAGQENPHQNHCPESFNCGIHGLIKFPFSTTSYSHCGLFTVRCNESIPKLNLGVKDQWYDTKDTFQGNEIRVKDNVLDLLINTTSCDVFSSYLNWALRPAALVSFTISPSLTLFKCTSINSQLDQQKADYFRGNHNYRGCTGYTVYYEYPNHHQEGLTNRSLPHNCAVIELPVLPPKRDQTASDLFSILASEYTIRFNVSKQCLNCHHDGGQCSQDFQGFRCLKEKKGRSYLIWILAAAVPGIGIIVILLFCFITKKVAQSESRVFWKNKTENYRNIEAFLKNCGSLSIKRYSYSDIKKITNSFRDKLGQGGYGFVFKGKLENGRLMAVKVLKGLKGGGEEFINEVATISRTSHVNVVTLLGYCFEGRHRALIYEFMPNGSLDKFIYVGNSSKYHQLGWEALYKIAVGIARGLEYLHRGCNTRILHFDIKPHNVLLDEDFCPKISDFGLAKLCPNKESVVSLLGARGTAGYIAPEVFCRNFGDVSHKSDVYSYGMMVLEMVGGRKNIDAEAERTSEIYFPHWVYKRLELEEELGLHGIMNDEAKESARKIVIVGLWCIQTDPLHRPSMSRVVEMLEGSLDSLQIPPKPYLSSPSRSLVADSSIYAPVVTS
ncbi:receptor serine/threonine kinase-like protein [Actinidia rufa]|uniref:non-specific serine/threonine protein kinase n=1 Tax=Actinidia rufa TaxID=165716 RepID=A0A7J0GZ93_9ERIC|nr:receptor serine/threonine kinase-like protein [Actinidia rufa]